MVLFSPKDTSGRKEVNDERRDEWILTVKLWLLVIAIFGTIILLGMWQ